MESKRDRGSLTRARIVDVAARLFALRGFAEVSIEMVLLESGVSRGALYHHFAGKEALFRDVLETVEARVARTVAAAAADASAPLEALRAGCRAWLRLAASDDAVRRIVLVDAPAVIGWEAWREIDARNALGLLKGGVRQIIGAAQGDAQVDALAHLLLAALIEAALLVSRASDADAVRASETALDRIIDALVLGATQNTAAGAVGAIPAKQPGRSKPRAVK